MKPSRDIARLLEIMAALRTPGTGCPWDLEQNFSTIAPYTIEEAYEVADAIARGDLADLRDELGDLLLQVVFHARMARGARRVRLRRRGRGDHREADPPPSACVRRAREGCRRRRSKGSGSASRPRKRPSGRPRRPDRRRPARSPACRSAMPALTRALKLQAKAGKVGFDWNDPLAVLVKIREECDEIEAEIAAGERDKARPRSAICCSPWSISPAIWMSIRRRCLRAANAKFARRFGSIEQALARGQAPAGCDARRDGRALGRAKAAEHS